MNLQINTYSFKEAQYKKKRTYFTAASLLVHVCNQSLSGLLTYGQMKYDVNDKRRGKKRNKGNKRKRRHRDRIV